MPATVKTDTAETVLAALTERSESSAADLAAASGLGRSTVGKTLTALEAQGRVHRRLGRRENGRRLPDLWSPSAAPADHARGETLGREQAAASAACQPPSPGDGDTAADGEQATDSRPPAAAAAVPAEGVEAAEGEPAADGPKPRLRKGALRAMVLAAVNAQPEREHGPVGIAKTLGRSSGAVANALDRLVLDGSVTQTSQRPRRFTAIAAEAASVPTA